MVHISCWFEYNPDNIEIFIVEDSKCQENESIGLQFSIKKRQPKIL